MTDVIGNGKVVSLSYTLRLNNGEIVDYTEAGEPLEYLHGAENIVVGLERALEGLKVGDTRDVDVPPEEGYGTYSAEDVEVVERSQFPADLPLEIGLALELYDDEGDSMEAYVREVGEQHVTLDFNHPLAGETLHFAVEVLAIREATEEEVDHGHPHGMYDEDEDDFEDEDDLEDDDDDEVYFELEMDESDDEQDNRFPPQPGKTYYN
jgi:FKBP-type peptidyl-prolyl cis-trans isomerase SlyD